jgi:hypothetical protein
VFILDVGGCVQYVSAGLTAVPFGHMCTHCQRTDTCYVYKIAEPGFSTCVPVLLEPRSDEAVEHPV